MKELKLVFPNAQVLNRGGQVLSEIVESCRAHDYSDVVLLHDERGKPNCLIVCHLPYGPTAYFQLCNVERSAYMVQHKNLCNQNLPVAWQRLISVEGCIHVMVFYWPKHRRIRRVNKDSTDNTPYELGHRKDTKGGCLACLNEEGLVPS
ncbi:hypothetical protein ACLB2K_073466 [Fragaria x ananassa]